MNPRKNEPKINEIILTQNFFMGKKKQNDKRTGFVKSPPWLPQRLFLFIYLFMLTTMNFKFQGLSNDLTWSEMALKSRNNAYL